MNPDLKLRWKGDTAWCGRVKVAVIAEDGDWWAAAMEFGYMGRLTVRCADREDAVDDVEMSWASIARDLRGDE